MALVQTINNKKLKAKEILLLADLITNRTRGFTSGLTRVFAFAASTGLNGLRQFTLD